MRQEQTNTNSRLSRIETLWSVVRRAHDDESLVATTAQQELLQLYGGAIQRYLLAAVRNEDLADELFQEFALKFVNGDFHSLDPARGRFRGFVKTVLSRLVASHFRKKTSRREREWQQGSEPIASASSEDDERFLISWRDDLLEQTWERLANHEAETGVPYHSILRLRADEPGLDSTQLAARMSMITGKKFTSGASRVTLHRARDKFAQLMIEVVSDSLIDPTCENIESELIELRLIDYCRQTLDQRKAE